MKKSKVRIRKLKEWNEHTFRQLLEFVFQDWTKLQKNLVKRAREADRSKGIHKPPSEFTPERIYVILDSKSYSCRPLTKHQYNKIAKEVLKNSSQPSPEQTKKVVEMFCDAIDLPKDVMLDLPVGVLMCVVEEFIGQSAQLYFPKIGSGWEQHGNQ